MNKNEIILNKKIKDLKKDLKYHIKLHKLYQDRCFQLENLNKKEEKNV